MKHLLRVLLLALILLLCAGISIAEDENTSLELLPAAAERLGVELPDGLVANIEYADGMIHIEIDDQATDWEKVICSGGNYPHIRIAPYVERPSEDYESHSGFTGGFRDVDQDYMLAFIERELENDPGFENKEYGWNFTRWQNGYHVGEIVPSRALLIPQTDGDPTAPLETWGGSAICWVDYDDPSVRYYEFVGICVTHKSTKPFNIPLRFITADTLSATRNITIPENVEITEIKNGEITFTVIYVEQPEEESTSEGTFFRDYLKIAMNVPEGATSGYIAHDMGRSEPLSIENGIAYIELYGPNYPVGLRIDERLYTIVWTDDDGNIVDYGVFFSYVVPPEHEPWACYVENWHPIDESRMEIINGAAGCGVTAEYNPSNGIFHVGYDSAASITGSLQSIKVNVTPPEGAAGYRMNGSGGNMIMGRDNFVPSEQHFVVVNQDYHSVPEGETLRLYDRDPLREVEAGPVTVYIQSGDVWKYGGGVQLIYWYASEEAAINDPENPMYIEYLCDTNGVLCQEKRVSVITSEEDITSPVTEVTPVGKYNWTLVVRKYPQIGDDAQHWELQMENETGVYQPLTENMIFYVPYPDGFDRYSACTYEMRHYDEEYSGFALVELRCTDYGLRFEVASLSPFVMSWDEIENTRILALPSSIKYIGEEAFMGADITGIVLPDGTLEIESRAFAGCPNLISINLPATIENIAPDAFSGCELLTATVVEGSYAHNWCVDNNVHFKFQ